MNIKKEFEIAKEDAELLSKINPEEMLRELTNKKNNYLVNKTSKTIENDKWIVLHNHYKSNANLYIDRLEGYRLVDEVDSLHIGKQTRWISIVKDKPVLVNGGVLVNIVFGKDGILLRIQLWSKKIIQIRMDENLVFQKISYGEQLVLFASNIVHK